jgi:AbrB family looped-hinge helix DNA binding protein
MTVTVKNKTPLVVPSEVRRRAGFKGGDELEFEVLAGVVTIRPKHSVAAPEYTAAQRRIIDRGIAKGLSDIKGGRVHGPFGTADEAVSYLEDYARRRQKPSLRKTVR